VGIIWGMWSGGGASAAVREMHLKFSLHTCRLKLQRICRVALCALFLFLVLHSHAKATAEVTQIEMYFCF